MKRVMIGTAGHIDHGKTTLVQKLTGVDPSRHPEERARGMTIDIGFAPLFVEPDLVAGMVDVPGHERFIRNMVAGATGIDLVLLAVAADDGVMPQTREHLQILRLLGIRRGVVALTKADLVGPEEATLAEEDVRGVLQGTFLEASPLIAVSSKTGRGIEELRQRLRQEADRVTPKNPEGIFRLPIQRVFSLKGFGTVVTGIPFSGRIRTGDPVEIVPAGKTARVRGIQAYGKSAEEAQAGHSVSLNLTELSHEEVHRGDVAATPGYLHPVTRIEAKFRYIGVGAKPLKDLAAVRLLLGTAEACGRLALVDGKTVAPGQEAFVQLRLDSPVVAVPGDRYILRLESPALTLGGGTVVGISDRRLRRSRKDLAAGLGAQEKAIGDPRAHVQAFLESCVHPVEAAQVAKQCLLEAGQVRLLLEALRKEERSRPVGKRWVSEKGWREAASRILEAVQAFHRQSPAEVGIERTSLREQLKIDPDLFQLLVEDLVRRSAIREAPGSRLAASGHQAQLTGKAAAGGAVLENRFRDAGFSPPTAEEALAGSGLSAKESKDALTLLVQQGTLVHVGEGIFFHREHVERARRMLVAAAQAQGQVESGKFRDLLKTTRKYIIPLLEYFDAQGLTKRVGNQRFLRKFSR